MTSGIELTTAVTAATDELTLSPDVATRLGIDDGDPVAVQSTVEDRTALRASVDDTVSADAVQLAQETAERLGVGSDRTVFVDTVSVSPAEQITVAPVVRLSIRSGEQLIRSAIGDRLLGDGDTVSVSLFDGSLDIPLRVISTRPSGPVRVTTATTIDIRDGPAPVIQGRQLTPLAPTAVGGYETTIEAIETAVARPLQTDENARFDVPHRAGVVLAGPHGIGKTHLVRHAAWLADATVHDIDVGRLVAGSYDTARDHLETVANRAAGSGRALIHLDALDTVLEEGAAPLEPILRSWLDEIGDRGDVLVVAEVTDPNSLPVTLVQGQRLSREITVPEPTRMDRCAILDTIASGIPTGPDLDLRSIGERAFGYVPADLVTLWLDAVHLAAARAIDTGEPFQAEHADVERALEETEPSGIRGSDLDVPSISFDDIGGLAGPKRELVRAVEWPLAYPELFDSVDIDPPSGVLLYGPPGTGKTMLARAVAATTDANFISVNGPELMNKYVGESERGVRRVFDRARSNAPAVIFFDEVDALGAGRGTDAEGSATERVVSQLLTEMDGLEQHGGLTVVGATNRPDRLDDALLRPGRFDRVVSVPVPDAATRAEIFRIHTADRTTATIDFDAAARRTEGYTGSDIAAVVREAGLLAIEDRITEPSTADGGPRTPVRITGEHLEAALSTIDPSVHPETDGNDDTFG